jgi:hypothetical protein
MMKGGNSESLPPNRHRRQREMDHAMPGQPEITSLSSKAAKAYSTRPVALVT